MSGSSWETCETRSYRNSSRRASDSSGTPSLRITILQVTRLSGSDPELDLERNVIEAPGLEPISFSMNPRIRNKLLTGSVDEMFEVGAWRAPREDG